MKARELIEELKELDPNTRILVGNIEISGITETVTGKITEGFPNLNPVFRYAPKGIVKAIRFTIWEEFSDGAIGESIIYPAE